MSSKKTTAETLGENQWVQPKVANATSQNIALANFAIKWGKFFDINKRFNEVASPQGAVISPGGSKEWGHSGRQNSPSGTEGTFEIRLDSVNGEVIARIYWDCPYTGSNKIEKQYEKAGYRVFIEGFKVPSGALDKGTITVVKF